MTKFKSYLPLFILLLYSIQGFSQNEDLNEGSGLSPDEELYWKGNQAALEKDFKTVLKIFNDYLKRNKENEHAYLLRSEAHFFFKNYKETIEDCEKVLALGSSPTVHDYNAMWNLANAKIGLNKFDQALKYLDICQENDKHNAKYYEVKIYTFFQLKDYESVIKEAKQLITIDPKSLKAHYGIARALLQQEKLPEALEAFNQTIVLYPDYALAYQNRGSVKMSLNDLTGGCEDWKRSLELGLEASKNYIREYCE